MESIMDKPPVLAHQELDLYNFCILVLKCGGFHSVVENEGTWSRIFKALPNYSKTETSASYRLKRIYQKFLLDFQNSIARGGRITATTGLGRVLKDYVNADYGEAMDVTELNDDSEVDEDEDSSEDMISRFQMIHNHNQNTRFRSITDWSDISIDGP